MANRNGARCKSFQAAVQQTTQLQVSLTIHSRACVRDLAQHIPRATISTATTYIDAAVAAAATTSSATSAANSVASIRPVNCNHGWALAKEDSLVDAGIVLIFDEIPKLSGAATYAALYASGEVRRDAPSFELKLEVPNWSRALALGTRAV